MSAGGILYYITDRSAFPGDEASRRSRLLHTIAEAASAGVDYIQLRERDLTARDLEALAREAVSILRHSPNPKTALLINSRTDVALASGANGVHLTAHDVNPPDVRTAWGRATNCGPVEPPISISCHSPEATAQAAVDGATLGLFAAVFEKKNAPAIQPQGLNALRKACRAKMPVLALGGITLDNFESCLQAGAAGIAAIRLFQENNIAAVTRQLRGA
jgi:thiamine-phosphate pyrophosphorylase